MTRSVVDTFNSDGVGQEMYDLIEQLYPICRSITGNGVRQSIDILQQHLPIEVHEVPSGTEVFDWRIPKEWNVTDAYIKNSKGERVVDFRESNLHVVNYSVPVRARMSLEDLRTHLFTHPTNEDWIPYRTSYYSETWGFCLSARQLNALEDDEYEVVIDSTLEEGSLTLGEFYKEGESDEEILLSSHICHPSLCNDNLSGVALSLFLAKYLADINTHYSYRFLFIPGTIGSISWLSMNKDHCHRIKGGLVVACVGDPGKFHYKRSRMGNALIDCVAEYVLKSSGEEFDVLNFSPDGYDERQYCSPGFNLPVGRLTRSPDGAYPEYHSSADNLELVTPAALDESFRILTKIIGILERNRTYINTNPHCEPQLGKRGLLDSAADENSTKAMLWILNRSDGENSLLDIAQESGIPFDQILDTANTLTEHDLLIEFE